MKQRKSKRQIAAIKGAKKAWETRRRNQAIAVKEDKLPEGLGQHVDEASTAVANAYKLGFVDGRAAGYKETLAKLGFVDGRAAGYKETLARIKNTLEQ